MSSPQAAPTFDSARLGIEPADEIEARPHIARLHLALDIDHAVISVAIWQTCQAVIDARQLAGKIADQLFIEILCIGRKIRTSSASAIGVAFR